jgi:hypothetical protein
MTHKESVKLRNDLEAKEKLKKLKLEFKQWFKPDTQKIR